METSAKRNFVFISYNHKDVKWAKWLQKKLEWYRLPTEIHNEFSDSRYIRPVFRDRDMLTSGVLNAELRSHLEASKYLVVICSPNSAQSEWVSDEIKAFMDMGRLDKIVPFIVEGSPQDYSHADIKQPLMGECFPLALRQWNAEHPDKNLLGIAVTDDGKTDKQKAFIRLVAHLLGVEFDTLWQRHKRQLVRNAILWTIGIIAIIAALTGVWLKNQPVDVTMKLSEVSAHNEQLPPLKDAVVTVTLDNETKTDTVHSLDANALFTNIPHRYLNKEVKVAAICQDFLDIDTTLILTKTVTLNIRRDPSVYGDIHFRLWNPNTEKVVANAKIEVDGRSVTSDNNGQVSLFIPIGHQRKSYSVTASFPLADDTIYMPCGEDDVILVGKEN